MGNKQAIVMRKDLKMRRGKEIAQGAHASMKWLCERIKAANEKSCVCGSWSEHGCACRIGTPTFSEPEKEWMAGLFAKITLQVDSEEELRRIYFTALHNGLMVYLITDSGATEFNGVPTVTCLAIGPDTAERIDPVTRDLKLY